MPVSCDVETFDTTIQMVLRDFRRVKQLRLANSPDLLCDSLLACLTERVVEDFLIFHSLFIHHFMVVHLPV